MFDNENVEVKYLYLNTGNRSLGEHYDATFIFNNATSQQFFNCSPDENIKAHVVSCVLPNDFEELDGSINRFDIILPGQTTPYTYQFTIPEGSPNVVGLVANLNALFTATTFNYWNGSSVATLTIVASFNAGLNVLTFTLSQPTNPQIEFRVDNSAYQVLGFLRALYQYNNVTSFSSPLNPDTSRLSEIYIYSNMVLDSAYTQYNDGVSNLDNCNIFFSFPLTNEGVGTNIIYQTTDYAFQQIIQNNIDRINLQVRDRNNNFVYINSPASYTIQFTKTRGQTAIAETRNNRMLGIMYG